ncbi:MAG: DNA gyrase C-terminal beta-propeller domain-containing protein, partial [Bacilli bacterium]
ILVQILENEEALKHVIKTELKLIKKEYATPRKTEIKEEVTEIKIDTTSLIPKEDCMVIVTSEGYVKRVSMRSFAASDEETGLKEKDYVLGLYEANTMDTLLLFTDLGNFLYIPVYELPDLKWKDLGKHISNIIKISSDENIISSYLTSDFSDKINFLSFTKNGMIKQTNLADLKVQRYSKPITLIKLKGDDKVVNTEVSNKEIFITTENGYGLRYKTDEVPTTGLRGSGVKAINLKNDIVVSGKSFNDAHYVAIITDKNTAKRIKIEEFELTSRARKGIQLVRDVKTNPYHIINSFIIKNKVDLGIITDEIKYLKITELPICDRYQTGTTISKDDIEKTFIKTGVQENEEPEIDVSLDKVDEQIMTIDDFLGDFKID